MRRCDGEGDAPSLPEDGLDDKDVGNMHAAVEGVVEDEHIAVFHAETVLLEQCRHRERHRTQVERDSHALRDHLSLRVAQRGRIVKAIAHDGRIRRAIECQRHLICRGGQGILDDFAGDGINHSKLISRLL